MNAFDRLVVTSSLQQLDVGAWDQDPLSIFKLRLEDAHFASCGKKPKVGGKSGHLADPAEMRLPDNPDLIARLESTPGFGHFLFRPLTADR